MTVGSCLHETVSAVRWLWYLAQRDRNGFIPKRRSLAALPLKVECSYFRANVYEIHQGPMREKGLNVSLLESYPNPNTTLP